MGAAVARRRRPRSGMGWKRPRRRRRGTRARSARKPRRGRCATMFCRVRPAVAVRRLAGAGPASSPLRRSVLRRA